MKKAIPGKLIVPLLRKAINEVKKVNEVIYISGFPRTLNQLYIWEKWMSKYVKNEAYIIFTCPLYMIRSRMIKKRKDHSQEYFDKAAFKDDIDMKLEFYEKQSQSLLNELRDRDDVAVLSTSIPENSVLNKLTHLLKALIDNFNSEEEFNARKWVFDNAKELRKRNNPRNATKTPISYKTNAKNTVNNNGSNTTTSKNSNSHLAKVDNKRVLKKDTRKVSKQIVKTISINPPEYPDIILNNEYICNELFFSIVNPIDTDINIIPKVSHQLHEYIAFEPNQIIIKANEIQSAPFIIKLLDKKDTTNINESKYSVHYVLKSLNNSSNIFFKPIYKRSYINIVKKITVKIQKLPLIKCNKSEKIWVKISRKVNLTNEIQVTPLTSGKNIIFKPEKIIFSHKSQLKQYFNILVKYLEAPNDDDNMNNINDNTLNNNYKTPILFEVDDLNNVIDVPQEMPLDISIKKGRFSVSKVIKLLHGQSSNVINIRMNSRCNNELKIELSSNNSFIQLKPSILTFNPPVLTSSFIITIPDDKNILLGSYYINYKIVGKDSSCYLPPYRTMVKILPKYKIHIANLNDPNYKLIYHLIRNPNHQNISKTLIFNIDKTAKINHDLIITFSSKILQFTPNKLIFYPKEIEKSIEISIDYNKVKDIPNKANISFIIEGKDAKNFETLKPIQIPIISKTGVL